MEDGRDDKSKDSIGTSSSVAVSAVQAKRKPISKPNILDLPFDRQMVATKLAAALVLQGREDVSTEDMDKLIYFFLLMVKLSKAKREVDGKPAFCKNILPELGLMPAPIAAVSAPATLAVLPPSLVEGHLDNDFENDVALEKEVSKQDANASTLESLTDSDLQTLLQNFKHLSSEEQHHLIAHLKKLESVDPERVEKLRKYVNTSDVNEPVASTSKSSGSIDGSQAIPLESFHSTNHNYPISASGGGKHEKPRDRPSSNIAIADVDERSRIAVNPNKFSLDDDDDDDYNFDEVFKAASKNVSTRTPDETSRHSATDGNSSKSVSDHVMLSSHNDLTFNPAGLKDSLSDTQNLIANLMGSLQQSNSESKVAIKKTTPSNSSHPQPVPPVGSQQTAPQQKQQQQQPQQTMSYFQQQGPQSQHQMPGGYPDMQQQPTPYNQMGSNYYNAMGGYNQNPYGGYQQWGPGNQQQIPGQNMQQFGMSNYGGGGYYGQGGN